VLEPGRQSGAWTESGADHRFGKPGDSGGGDQERQHAVQRHDRRPDPIIPGAPECPNPNWTEEITDLSFTSATITVEQPPGTVVLTVTCSFSAPTANGAVPGGNVSCVQS
jgi:hypothetical protein